MVERAAALTALLVTLVLAGCAQPRPVVFTGSVMGTTWSVQILGDVDADMETTIAARLGQINDRMTTYSKESELARFSASADTDWMTVSAELAVVVAEAQRVAALTEGAFDVTVSPLVELWGFGSAGATDEVPGKTAIAAVRSRVGYQQLAVTTQPPALRKNSAGLTVDLSAIAKGYAVDQVAALLAARGLRNYLVEIGGELKAAGSNSRGESWNIAVEQPTPGARRVQRAFHVADLAVATSGDYRNFFERDGRRYSHTIDPRTGYPVNHELASVTVLNPSAMAADAYATGLLVLGDQDGYDFALTHDLAALFVVRDGSDFRERATPRFEALTARTS
jgi:thiamine biosynthesis lipoprotein